MTKPEFATCMAVLSAGVSKPMTEVQMDAWWLALSDITAEQLHNGVALTLRQHKFAGLPPIAVVREYALGGPDRAIAAWDAVVVEISRVGGYRSIEFDDPLINAAIRGIGGWVKLTETEVDQLQWRRKEFIETYRALSIKGISAERAAPLAGIIECQSTGGPSDPPPAVQIQTGLPSLPVKILGTRRESRRMLRPAEVDRISERLAVLSPPTEEDAQHAAEKRAAQDARARAWRERLQFREAARKAARKGEQDAPPPTG